MRKEDAGPDHGRQRKMLSTLSLQIITAVVAVITGLLILKVAVTPKEFNAGRRALVVLLGIVVLLLAVAWVYITIRMTNLVTSTFASIYLPIVLLVLVAVVAIMALVALGRAKKSMAVRKEEKAAAKEAKAAAKEAAEEGEA